MKLSRIPIAAIAAAAVISLAAITGCGSESPQAAVSSGNGSNNNPGGSSSGASACSLVTKADMETALGQPFKDPAEKTATATAGTVCSYESTAQTSLGLPQMQILVMYYPGMNPGQDPTRKQTVSGIGDDAYYSDAGINVIKGTDWLVISYLRVSNPGADPRLEQLAGKAATRM